MAEGHNGDGKVRSVRTHRKYGDLIVSAVATLAERKGSSKQAIFKHIVQNYKLADNPNAVSGYMHLCCHLSHA